MLSNLTINCGQFNDNVKSNDFKSITQKRRYFTLKNVNTNSFCLQLYRVKVFPFYGLIIMPLATILGILVLFEQLKTSICNGLLGEGPTVSKDNLF